jgi:hypothetical protein
LLRGCLERLPDLQLALAGRVHDRNASDRTAGTPECLKAEHRSHHALYASMILLHEIIHILRVSTDHGRLVRAGVPMDCGGVAPTLLNRNLLGQSLVMNGLT